MLRNACDAPGAALEQLLENAQTCIDSGDFAGAEQQLRRALSASPHDPRPALRLGLFLLDLGREEGINHLKHAMAQDERITLAACRHAIQFLEAAGEDERACGFARRLAAWCDHEQRGDDNPASASLKRRRRRPQ
ncbi:MAG: tetratricopeptide repeat protein [Pseudomonadota bacterium]